VYSSRYQAPGNHQPLVQFRDEDIALADELLEGKADLRQLPSQNRDNMKQGTKRNRKQSHGKHQQSKKEKTATEQDEGKEKSTEDKSSKKDFKKKYRKPKQSKSTEHSEKDKT